MFVELLPSGRYRGGFRLPVSGKKIARSFDYRHEAEAWALTEERRAKAAAEAGTTAPQAPAVAAEIPAPVAPVKVPTVAAWGTKWVDRRAGRLASATLSNYRHHIAYLTAEGLGGRPLNTVKRSDVEQWQTDGVAAGVGKPTLNARLKVLGMIYRDAMAEIPEAVTHNPAQGVAPLTADIRPDRVLTEDEETRLLAAAGPDNRLPVLLALDAGLRWSEAFGLPEDAVMGDYLVVRQVVERDAGTLRAYPKGHRERVVPLTPRLAAELKTAAKRARKARGRGALLFVNEVGGIVDYFNYRHRTFRPMMRAAKVKPAPGFHALRHTYGSRLAAAGVPRSEIAVLMGHADESTTARYIHAGDDGRRLALVRAALAQTA